METDRTNESPFKSVVFAGGGSRCLWQVGFWDAASPRLNIWPETVAAVSAGATMAACIFSGRSDFALSWMKKATAANKKNVYPEKFIRRGDRVFPHWRIYREAILTTLDRQAISRLQAGPEVRVLLAHPPRWSGPITGVAVGLACYLAEKRMRNRVHPQWAVRAGFSPRVVNLKECGTAEQIAEVLLGSSCTPPLLPIMRREGKPVLDGGLIDNVPLTTLDPGSEPVLVLLTRQYPKEILPESTKRYYVQPSQPIAIYKWDYTNPRGLQAAYDLGRLDGEVFAKRFEREWKS